MILPEDVENGMATGSFGHALGVAIPGPRNLNPGNPQPADVFYPAATTENEYYSMNPSALAAGQRLRMKSTLVSDDDLCPVIDEDQLAPITRMFINTMRTHGAYVVDNAGGFTFYAEDYNTATLNLSDAEVQTLIGGPIPSGYTKWEAVMETLNDDVVGMSNVPFACGEVCDGASTIISVPNWEVVDPAERVIVFMSGFEIGDARMWSGVVP